METTALQLIEIKSANYVNRKFQEGSIGCLPVFWLSSVASFVAVVASRDRSKVKASTL